MKTQLDKLAPWVSVDDPEEGISGMLTPAGFVTREDLYETVEYEHTERRTVTVSRIDLWVGHMDPLIPISAINQGVSYGAVCPMLVVAVPGMCGHYRCGSIVTVSMN